MFFPFLKTCPIKKHPKQSLLRMHGDSKSAMSQGRGVAIGAEKILGRLGFKSDSVGVGTAGIERYVMCNAS